MVPEVGDYKTLPWTEHGKVLVHGPDGIHLMSNTGPASHPAVIPAKAGTHANLSGTRVPPHSPSVDARLRGHDV